MLIYIMTLCTALYQTHASDTAYTTTCVSYSALKRYDTRWCPGEVTTDIKGHVATCEITVPRP